MSNPQIVGATIGLILGGTIFWLLRRDHMLSRDGLRWLIVAALVILYGSFPRLNDLLGTFLGISYPPIIPVLVGMAAILVKLLLTDIERIKSQVDIQRLVQRVAILEAELEQVKSTRDHEQKQQQQDKQ